MAELAKLEILQTQRADGNTPQGQHLMADARENTADFAVFTFGQHDFEQRAVLHPLDDRGAHATGHALGKVDAAAKLLQHFRLRLAGNLCKVCLLDAVARMGQLLGKRSVVGQQHEPFAGHVESTDGKQPLLGRRHEVEHPRTTSRVVAGRQVSGWFVDQVINFAGDLQPLTIDTDLLRFRVDTRPQLRDILAVDLHPPLRDQLFAMPAAADTRGGHNLLQAFAMRRRGDWFGVDFGRVVVVGFDRINRVGHHWRHETCGNYRHS